MECSNDGCAAPPLCRLVLALYADPTTAVGETASDFVMCRKHGAELAACLPQLLDSFDWEQLAEEFNPAPLKRFTRARLEFFS